MRLRRVRDLNFSGENKRDVAMGLLDSLPWSLSKKSGRICRRQVFMKAVIQRVQNASVAVDGKEVSAISKGFLTLLGVAKGDTEEQLKKLMQKIIALRIFPDADGKMNLSLADIQGEHLIVSQFTLLGDASKGNRPSFIGAETPDRAKELYEQALALSQAAGIKTQGGVFGGDMKVSLLNDGPVTLILEV